MSRARDISNNNRSKEAMILSADKRYLCIIYNLSCAAWRLSRCVIPKAYWPLHALDKSVTRAVLLAKG